MTELSTKVTPTTAERIRSAFARAGGAMLAVEGLDPAESPVHHLLDDGSFAITVPVDGAVAAKVVSAGAAGVQAVLEMTDYAPLPLREPVRSLVWIRGRLHDVPAGEVPALLDLIATEDPNPALLQVNSGDTRVETDDRYALMRLEIDSVVVADSTGAESVGLSALLGRAAGPVLRDGVLLAATHGVGPPRGGRPVGQPAADLSAPRTRPATRPGPLRCAASRRGR